MSLVNDLLIEVDRRRERQRSRAGTPIDDLAPSTPLPRPRPRHLVLLPMLLATAGGAIVALVSLQLLSGDAREKPTTTRIAALEEAPPSVSAHRPASSPSASAANPDFATGHAADSTAGLDVMGPATAGLDAPPAAAPARTRTQAQRPGLEADEATEHLSVRPTSIRGIEIERYGHTTRLRIRADVATPFRIEETANDRQVEIFLESAAIDAPIRTLDLLGTPIRRIQTRASGGGVQLSLTLDSAPRIQSQWIENARGASLIVELQDSPPKMSSTVESEAVGRTRPGASAVYESPAETDWLMAAPGTSLDGAPPGGSEMHIARSAGDRARLGREAAHSRAVLELEAARFARAEGDLAEASRRYAAALEVVPGFRDAILEWATLHAARGEVDAAIALLRDARRNAPRDTGLLMLHARLVADGGNHDAAIQILDRAGLRLAEAPEVHALAAAYVQKVGEHDEAIERYETILKRFPGRSSWWMGLGISLEAEGRRAEAIDVYGIAMQVGELPGNTRRWVSARVDALQAEED